MDDSPTILVFDDAHEPLLPSWVVVCFTINVIMGSGFLGVPGGFGESGVVLGPLVLIGVSLMQWVAACMLAQVVTRAHALLTTSDAAATLSPTLIPLAKSEAPSAAGGSRLQPPSLQIPSHTSYEIMMLCRLHLGRWAERTVMLSVAAYQFGTLWSFISVFASSMTAMVAVPGLLGDGAELSPCDIYKTEIYGGGCITLYYFWVLAFAVVMVALMGLDVREQVSFQCCMTVARGLIILLMVGTLLLGSRADFGLAPLAAAESSNGGGGHAAAAEASPPLPLFRWSGLPKMVPIGVFCQLFQIGVPSLLQPLGNKRELSAIFGTALTTTLAMYTALGLAAVGLLTTDVDPSCNLNWSPYQPRAIALAVSLFPALDCLSVFPMNAIFLSNNLLSCLFQRQWHAGRVGRRARYACRLACCVPPFACAFAFPSLSKALDFTGIVGILLPFLVTPALHLASLRECRARWGREAFDQAEAAAGYARYGCSSPAVVRLFGGAGALLLAYTVGCGLAYGF